MVALEVVGSTPIAHPINEKGQPRLSFFIYRVFVTVEHNFLWRRDAEDFVRCGVKMLTFHDFFLEKNLFVYYNDVMKMLCKTDWSKNEDQAKKQSL